MEYEELEQFQPFELNCDSKKQLLTKRLFHLTHYHFQNCTIYRKMLESRGIGEDYFELLFQKESSYYDLPFLPVRLFKELDLRSVPESEILKTMTSSGTGGQSVSKIYCDGVTAANQQRAMVQIVSDFIGSSRMPMLILDSPAVLKDRTMFSARGAGILGFSIFGTDRKYAFREDMSLDLETISSFLEKHKGKKIFLFGFTYMVWQYFYQELKRQKELKDYSIDLSDGILIHGGGWKKLQNEAVGSKEFRLCLYEICGIEQVYDYYGMVEQTGCIYMECECGHLHASIYSDVIVRRPYDFHVAEQGETGILQVVSVIPESYPGHSLLTEDEGVILGEDDCPCGRKGKYFRIMGRLKNAEIRGCSDTYGETGK